MNSFSLPDRTYFRIGDVSEIVGVKPHVLRYWESEFSEIQPEKSSTGQRVYSRKDVETVLLIRHLLQDEKYSIEGARQKFRELRREGELARFRKEVAEPMTIEEKLAREGAIRRAEKILEEAEGLNSASIRDLFRY
ncbi:MAG: hypothetical protein RJB38_216 [Pseudomonadota bacterium]